MENVNRNRGYYWVKFQGEWGIALWTGRRWEYDLSVMIAEDFEEIGGDPIQMPCDEALNHQASSLPILPEVAVPDASQTPDAEHRFFVYCPNRSAFFYFKNAAERDLFADKDVIESFLDDGWHDGVEQVVCGEITHTCVKADGDPVDFEMRALTIESTPS